MKRAVTRVAVKEARLAEIKQARTAQLPTEPPSLSFLISSLARCSFVLYGYNLFASVNMQELLNSERLQQHFQQNPHEFQVLSGVHVM